MIESYCLKSGCSPKQSSSPEYEKNGEIQQKGKGVCLGLNHGIDDLYLEFNYLKTRCYLFLFQKKTSERPGMERSKLIQIARGVFTLIFICDFRGTL